MSQFFEDLESFSDFSEITEDSHYLQVPNDWTVFVADIAGSSEFFSAQRFKELNILAAATVVAAQNAMLRKDFPFAFGPDFTALVIPIEFKNKVISALNGVRHLAESQYRIPLKFGMVSVGELNIQGAPVLVGKFRLPGGKNIAVFCGGGLSRAKEKVRRSLDMYAMPRGPVAEADLNGLSCRWQPVPAQNGKIVTFLAAARTQDAKSTFQHLMSNLDTIFEGDFDSVTPVHLSNLRYESFGSLMKEEKRYHQRKFSGAFFSRVLEIFAAVMVFKYKVPPLFFNPRRYAASMGLHCDYRKFADHLGMVVDCHPNQIAQLRESLWLRIGRTLTKGCGAGRKKRERPPLFRF